jgi:hypothetical protein
VNGEAGRLAALHDLLSRRYRDGDRLIYLGNYVGRGAAVAETIAELLSFRRAVMARRGGFACEVVFLRGSQEEMWQKLLQLQFATNPGEVLRWMLAQGMGTTLAAYGADPEQGLRACREGALGLTRWTGSLRAAVNAAPGHTQLMSALRRAAFTDAPPGALLFVHAGIAPDRPLDAQKDAFWWGGAGFLEMTQPYPGYARVIRGYDRQQGGLVETPFAVSLDAGCGAGGKLLAACFAASGEILDLLEA